MHKYKLVIFDWDGTVMDSVGRIVSSMRSAAKEAELTIPNEEQVKNIIGLSLPEAAKVLFPQLPEHKENQLIMHYKRHYTELDQTPSPMFENAIQLFENLLERNKYLAVATGKGRAGLERVWEATSSKQYFSTSRCAQECQSKPHPEMLFQIMDELSILPSEAVMIGDTIHDMAMAKNAKVDRIGVTFGVHDHKTLSAFEPKAIVNSMLELQQLLIK